MDLRSAPQVRKAITDRDSLLEFVEDGVILAAVHGQAVKSALTHVCRRGHISQR